MKDRDKTKEDFGELSRAELISELVELGQRVAELEAVDTGRKRAEEALRKSEERYRYFVEQTAEGFYRIESEQRIPINFPEDEQIKLMYEHMYVAECNDIFAREYGFSEAEDMIGTRFVGLHGNADIPENIDALRSFVRNGCIVIDVETQETDKEGNSIWFLNNAVGIVENEYLLSVWGTQRDITERKRAEEELVQRQLRLSVLNRMGRALAGTFELVRIYRIAYEHVAQLVDCPCFGISLYDPPTRALRAEFMLDDGELIDAARFPPMVMGIEPTQGRVRAIITRQPEIITDFPAVLEKATDSGVRVGVSENVHVTGAAMYVPMVARGQVIGLLEVQSYRLDAYSAEHAALLGPVANQIGLSIQNAQLYEEAQQQLAERKRAEEELQRTLEKLREALGGIIQTVALTVETKDPYTAGHQRRVGNLARAIATEMGLSKDQIEGIRMAGLIHDLGKIGVPAEILIQPGLLNDLQYGLIQAHSQVGYDILKRVDFPWPVAQMVLQHHERLDGSGYPQGLSGEEIMVEARILAVADVVEAMASFRPYRPALGIDKALEEISQNRGVLYDPEAVDACLKLFTENGFTFE